MLTNGNDKLGKDIYAFGLPTSTCHYATKICSKYCYAKRGNFNNNNCRLSYFANYVESTSDFFADLIVEQIKLKQIKWVRIHPSGDFYDQNYFDKWCDIANKSGDTKFLAYTRNYELDTTKAPTNLVIYYSTDNTTKTYNKTISLFAHTTFIKNREYHMERRTIKKMLFFVCQSKCNSCKACWSGRINIFFPLRRK